jgi:hypothetical protein
MTRGSRTSWAGHGDLEASLVLVFPLLLAYELGVLFTGHVNGVDVVTRAVYFIVGSRAVYLLVHVLLAALFLLWIRRARRFGTLRVEIALPVILEAAIYALTLGAAVRLVLSRVLGLGLDGGSLVDALGAGVHEELVFRLGILCGLARALSNRRGGLAIALAASSLAFAAAHHLGPLGEPWTAHAFAFRTLAGAAFGAMCWYRSLAHAVYAHVMYDIVVAAS